MRKVRSMRHFAAMVAVFFGLTAWGMDVNATLRDANATYFASMLKQLQKIPAQNDSIRLRAALLEKLVQLETEPAAKPITLAAPVNEEAYRALFDKAVVWSERFADLERQRIGIDAKQEAVGEQLLTLERNASNAMELQLSHAFFSKASERIERQQRELKSALKQLPGVMVRSLDNVAFDVEAAEKSLQSIKQVLHKLETAMSEAELEHDRLQLLESPTRAIEEKINRIKHKRIQLKRKSLNARFVLFSVALKAKATDAVFAQHSDIEQSAEKLFADKTTPKLLNGMMTTMEQERLGTARLLTGKTGEGIKTLFLSLWEKANEPLFSLNDNPISVFKIVMALAVLSLGFLLGGAYKRQVKQIGKTGRVTLSSSSKTLLANVGHYVIVVIAFFVTLKVLGVDLSSVAIVAGALSVGIGFGLQNIVSNFVSGLIIMLEKSIRIGDYIEFDETLRGHVSDIRMRSTTVTTNANIDIIVPNQDLIQSRVINWTMNDDIRRFEIPFGVAYGSDVHRVIEVVLSAVNDSGFEDIYTTRERHARVVMTGMGDSSVDFELFVWIRGHETLYPKRTASRFLVLIYDALYKAGIEIPFPQRDLHLKSSHAPISVRIERD
jgi:potassium efflux system protein